MVLLCKHWGWFCWPQQCGTCSTSHYIRAHELNWPEWKTPSMTKNLSPQSLLILKELEGHKSIEKNHIRRNLWRFLVPPPAWTRAREGCSGLWLKRWNLQKQRFSSPFECIFPKSMCNFEVYITSSGKSRTYLAPLLGELPSASAASMQVRSYSCDYSKWTCPNSRGFSWSFHQGQRIISYQLWGQCENMPT